MTGFRWGFPLALHLLCAVPALAAVMVYAAQMRARALRRFAPPEALPPLLAEIHPLRRALKSLLVLGATACAALVIAQPSWNAKDAVAAEGRDILVLVDVSKSMLARDAGANRLEVARDFARRAIGELHGERVGIAAFAGSAQILCPLTLDYDFARSALDGLSPAAADLGGTDVAGAIEKALDTGFDDLPRKSRVLVVLSDGESHGPAPDRARQKAEQRGVRLIAVGIGDAVAGARIPLPGGGFLTYAGQEVWSRLDRASLASAAPGGYVAGNEPDAARRLSRLIASGGANVRFAYDRQDGSYIPLLCGFGLLLVELLTPERRAKA